MDGESDVQYEVPLSREISGLNCRISPVANRIALARQHVAVNVEREGGVGVSHESRHADDVLAVTDHRTRVRVPQVVEANSPDASALARRVKATRDQVRVAHRLPVEFREHLVMGTLGAREPPHLKFLQWKTGERDAPIRGARLRLLKVETMSLPPSSCPHGRIYRSG
jgi:hypothetical protein